MFVAEYSEWLEVRSAAYSWAVGDLAVETEA